MDLAKFGAIVEDVNYLTVEDLILINKFVIFTYTPDEPVSVLKPNELESSQASPAKHKYYTQTDDMFMLTSVLMNSLVQNHCFANGNKRTAFLAGYVFLLLNGYELTAPAEDVVEMMVGIAEKEFNIHDIERWLAYWSRDFDSRNLCVPIEQMTDSLFANMR